MNPTTEQRELLELAAKAAGIPVQVSSFLGREGLSHAGSVTPWNPLTDDGDALRLASKLGITIDFHDCCAWKRLPSHALIQEFWGGDYPDSYEHAIVRAAAAIAKGEK